MKLSIPSELALGVIEEIRLIVLSSRSRDYFSLDSDAERNESFNYSQR